MKIDLRTLFSPMRPDASLTAQIDRVDFGSNTLWNPQTKLKTNGRRSNNHMCRHFKK